MRTMAKPPSSKKNRKETHIDYAKAEKSFLRIAKKALARSFKFKKTPDIHRVTESKVGALRRLVLTCALAKIADDKIDVCAPYTEIAGTRCFSGRVLDEHVIDKVRIQLDLPLNTSTGFLTPALRITINAYPRLAPWRVRIEVDTARRCGSLRVFKRRVSTQ